MKLQGFLAYVGVATAMEQLWDSRTESLLVKLNRRVQAGGTAEVPGWKWAVGPWDKTGAWTNKTFVMNSEDVQNTPFSSFVLSQNWMTLWAMQSFIFQMSHYAAFVLQVAQARSSSWFFA